MILPTGLARDGEDDCRCTANFARRFAGKVLPIKGHDTRGAKTNDRGPLLVQS